LFRTARLGPPALAANSPPVSGVSHYERIDGEPEMVELTKEARLKMAALAYVIGLHNELTQENGAPPLGTQNQAVDFILGDTELRRALADCAADADIDEMTTVLRWPPQDALCHRVRSYLEQIDGPRVFATAEHPSR
jgi:hypothetical protein